MIIITGASEGLGKEVAKLYRAAGKTVVNISRHESEFADHNLLHNLREGGEIEDATQAVEAINEPIEAIINCAGVYTTEPLGEITENEIKRTMATNVKSNILLVSNLIDQIKRDKSDVLFISSTAGTQGTENMLYSASKWAVRGFAKSLQEELRSAKNRVMIVCPAWFVKDTDPLRIKNPESTEWMKTEEVAKFIKQILDLPKNMEVSEVVINRK